ncbi:uncharacterized protein LOC126561328 [Anopheles maculipalpis]|uniref:uncharacterized protein LOC126561328 n=1 Tax=Anopheles maculipalpis TaxID=1496333 RepID=UPI0021597673|nr:uncharacterized protein LOC126561328 [Anopheles maculipalpis]
MAIECPVCTLYLRSGMTLAEHLDTHPKENVIKALVNRVKHDALSYYSGSLEELGGDDVIPVEGNPSTISTVTQSNAALTIRTNERPTSLGIYDGQPVYMDNAILASTSNTVQASVSQPPQFAVVKAIDAHCIPSFQLNNVTLIKREIVQPVTGVSGLSALTAVGAGAAAVAAAATHPPAPPSASIGAMQTELPGIGPIADDYIEAGGGEAGVPRAIGTAVATATVYPRYTNELYSGPPPPYSRAISSTIATNTQITPTQPQQPTVQLNVAPKPAIGGVVGQPMQMLPKLQSETSSSAFKQYATVQTVSDRNVEETVAVTTSNTTLSTSTQKPVYSVPVATTIAAKIATTAAITTTCSSISSSTASAEQQSTIVPVSIVTTTTTTSSKNSVTTPSKANVVKVISNVKVQSKLKDIQEIILQLNAGQMSIVGDKTTLIPPTTERRPSTFSTNGGSNRSLLAITPTKTEPPAEQQESVNMAASSNMENEPQEDDMEEIETCDYDHEMEYSDGWQDDDNYTSEEVPEQWEEAPQQEEKHFATDAEEQNDLLPIAPVTAEKTASTFVGNTNANSTGTSGSAMVTSVIRKTPQPVPCAPSPIEQEPKSQIKRLVFRVAGACTPTTVTISPAGASSSSPKIVRAWQGIKLECTPESSTNTDNSTAPSVPAAADETRKSGVSAATVSRDYAARQKQRFRPPKKLAIKPKRSVAEGGHCSSAAASRSPMVDGGHVAQDNDQLAVGSSASTTEATALTTLAEVVCTNAAQQLQQANTVPFSSTTFDGITAVIQKTDINCGNAQPYLRTERDMMSQQPLLTTPIKQEFTRTANIVPPADVAAKPLNNPNMMLGSRTSYTFVTPSTDAAGAAPNAAGRKVLRPSEEIDVGAYNISYVSETGETIYHPLPRKASGTSEFGNRQKMSSAEQKVSSASLRNSECAISPHADNHRETEEKQQMKLKEEEEKHASELQGDEVEGDHADHDEVQELDEDDMMETEGDVKEACNDETGVGEQEKQFDTEDEDYEDVFEVEPPLRQQQNSPSQQSQFVAEQPSRRRLLMVLTRMNREPSDAMEPVEADMDVKEVVEPALSATNGTNSAEQRESQMQHSTEARSNLPASLVMKRFNSGIITTDDEKDMLEAGPSTRNIVHVGVPRPKFRVTNAVSYEAPGRCSSASRKPENDKRKKSASMKRKGGKDFLEAGTSSSSSSFMSSSSSSSALPSSSHRFANGTLYTTEHAEDGGGCLRHCFNNPASTVPAAVDEHAHVSSLQEPIVGLKAAKTEPLYVDEQDEQDTTISSFLDLSTVPKTSLDGMSTNDTASNTSSSNSNHSAGLGKDSGEGSGTSHGGTRSLLPSGSSHASTSMERAPSTESLNIRTDEKMPAKGEISEQESNGDMDVTSWNHRMYAVGENVPIYPSSYDLSTAQECWNLSSRNQGIFAVTDHFYHQQQQQQQQQQQHVGINNPHGTTVSNQYVTSRVAFQFSSTSHQHVQQHGTDQLPFGGGMIAGKVEPPQDDEDSDEIDEAAEARRIKNSIAKMPFADMMVARIHEPPGAYDEVSSTHHHQQQACEIKYDDPVGTTSYFGVSGACSTLSLIAADESGLSNRPKPSGSGSVTRTFRCTLCPKVFDTIKQRRLHQQREHGNELLSLPSAHQEQLQLGEEHGEMSQQQQAYKKQPIPVVMNYDWMRQEIQRKSVAMLKSNRISMAGSSNTGGGSGSAIPGPSRSQDIQQQEQQQQLVVAQVEVGDGMLPACAIAARYRSYVCSTCNQKFDRFNLFNEHLLEHPVECSACGRHFKQWRNFSLHIKRHLGIKEHQCRSCGKQFVIKQKLIEHMRVHTGHAPIKCKLCNRTFKRFSNLAQHRKRYHLNRTVTKEDYVCPLCGEVFHTQAKMEWHKETHEKKPKPCPYCREKFIHRNSLTRHIRLSHTDKYAKLENKTEPCSICQQPYTKTSMRRHMETHTKERMAYSCGICNKRFTTNWNLKQHKWTHANPTMKPFQCTYCPSAFVRESDFVTHVNAHRSIRPYTCNHCGSQFIRKYNWIRHTREHEIDKGHRCDVCGRQFHRKYYLTEHKRIHTGERPFACNICGKTSATKTNHNKHVRIHHARDPLTAEG